MNRLFRVSLSLVIFTTAAACTDEGSSKNVELAQATTHNQIETYKDARRLLWSSLYSNGGKTLYCGKPLNSQRGNGFNVEHVFPMSRATNGLNCGSRKQCRNRSAQFNRIESDLHNLYPSRADVNQQRSSFRFGEIRGEAREFGKQCDFEVDRRARAAEPAPNVRGEVARSMFYMAYSYKEQGLEIFEKQARLLLRWHQADPPSDAEKSCNNAIEKLSGRRNPFIDQPEKISELVSAGYFF